MILKVKVATNSGFFLYQTANNIIRWVNSTNFNQIGSVKLFQTISNDTNFITDFLVPFNYTSSKSTNIFPKF